MRNKAAATVLHISGDFALPRYTTFKNFLWDKAQFVLVSLFVFVVTYLALNYQAIYENINYKLTALKGMEAPNFEILNESSQASVLSLDEISQDVSGLPPEKQEISSDSAATVVVPPLNLTVYPPDTRIVIPRIVKNIPVIGVGNANLISRDWDALEKDIQQALKSGVVHYPGTALPGEKGNVVITGHSSFYAWDAGRFKDVFALLHEIVPGDKIFLFHNQKRYIYEVFDIRVVKPNEIDVLGQTKDERLTLITCTPLGTNLKRLIVTAKRVN